MSQHLKLPASWQYFLLGVLLWVFVDFGTAGGFRFSYLQRYGVALLVFYLGYPFIFSLLIFKFQWNNRRLFPATLLSIFVVEVLFVRNPLVMSFPALLLGIPLAILIYTPLTFFPLWFVRKEMKKHRILLIGLTIVEFVIMALTTLGNSSS